MGKKSQNQHYVLCAQLCSPACGTDDLSSYANDDSSDGETEDYDHDGTTSDGKGSSGYQWLVMMLCCGKHQQGCLRELLPFMKPSLRRITCAAIDLAQLFQ